MPVIEFHVVVAVFGVTPKGRWPVLTRSSMARPSQGPRRLLDQESRSRPFDDRHALRAGANLAPRSPRMERE